MHRASALWNSRAGWEEKITSILLLVEFDTLAPVEFISSCWDHSSQPERCLMFAVLEDAVFCFQNYLSSQDMMRKKLFADAEHWLLDDNTEWPFSFTNICREIQLDKDFVRGGLLRWKHRMAASAQIQKRTGQKIPPAEYQKPGQNPVAITSIQP